MADQNKGKMLHGNRAKVEPNKEIESLYASNKVTISHRKDHEVPLVEDDRVEYAREFSEENEK